MKDENTTQTTEKTNGMEILEERRRKMESIRNRDKTMSKHYELNRKRFKTR